MYGSGGGSRSLAGRGECSQQESADVPVGDSLALWMRQRAAVTIMPGEGVSVEDLTLLVAARARRAGLAMTSNVTPRIRSTAFGRDWQIAVATTMYDVVCSM